MDTVHSIEIIAVYDIIYNNFQKIKKIKAGKSDDRASNRCYNLK
jgi:hypothetical protein